MEIMILCIYSSWRFWSIYTVSCDDHTCHILYHAYSWPLYFYVSRTAICTCSHMQIYLYCIDGWLVLPPSSSSLHFWDGLIMYFGHRITPLASHIRGASVTDNFTTHGRSHIYGLPCPSVDSLDPMDYFCTFDVSKIIPKNTCYLPYATFKPFLAYIRRYNSDTHVGRNAQLRMA